MRKNSSIRRTSGSKNLAPGGAGKYIRVETTGSRGRSTRAATVVSSTWPLRIRADPLKPSAYSTRNAIGVRRNVGRPGGGTKSRTFCLMSPGLSVWLRDRASLSSSAGIRPSSTAAQTASPSRQVTAAIPCPFPLVSRRSAMHCSVSSAWNPKISISPRDATTASFHFNPSGTSTAGSRHVTGRLDPAISGVLVARAASTIAAASRRSQERCLSMKIGTLRPDVRKTSRTCRK